MSFCLRSIEKANSFSNSRARWLTVTFSTLLPSFVLLGPASILKEILTNQIENVKSGTSLTHPADTAPPTYLPPQNCFSARKTQAGCKLLARSCSQLFPGTLAPCSLDFTLVWSISNPQYIESQIWTHFVGVWTWAHPSLRFGLIGVQKNVEIFFEIIFF